MREGASGNPTGVPEKGLILLTLFDAISICSYSLRMFEAGKEVCWPVTWEMVAPDLGEARSFIVLQFWVVFSKLTLPKGTFSKLTLPGDTFSKFSATGTQASGQLMSMYFKQAVDVVCTQAVDTMFIRKASVQLMSMYSDVN